MNHLIAIILCQSIVSGSLLRINQDLASWNSIQGNSPTPVRGEFTMNAWNGKLYMYGGCDIRFTTFFNDLWEFNTVNKKWIQIQTKGDNPIKTCGHGSAILGTKMYVYGGLNDQGETSNQLYYLDLETMTWTHVQNSGLWPPGRSLIQHSMVAISSDAFIISNGKSDDDDDGSYMYSNQKWSKISQGKNQKSDISGSSASYFKTIDELILLGGFSQSMVSENLQILKNASSIINDQFLEIIAKNGPPSLAFQASVAYQDKYLLVYGGFSSEINPYVWAYNVNQKLGQGNWCKLKIDGATPPPHFAGGWEILDDDIYAFGGRINPNDSGEQLSSDLWQLKNVDSAIQNCHFNI